MLDKRQAFKAGFLRKCANSGLTPDETHEVVKEALVRIKSAAFSDIITKPLSAVGGAISGLVEPAAKNISNLGLAALLLGPPAVGGGLGLLAAKAGDIDETDVETTKQRELIDEYHRQTSRMRRKQQYLAK